MKINSFDQYINILIICFAFTLSTTKAGIVFFTHLIFLSYILRGNYSSALTELKKSKPIIILTLFLALNFISIIWADDPTFALKYIKGYYHLLVIPVIYLSFNPKYINHVLTSFLLGIFISEILSFAIYFNLIEFNNIRPTNPTPFISYSNYSIYLSFAAMIALSKIFFCTEKKHQVFYYLFLALTIINLFINYGTTGQVIFLITVSIFLFLKIKNKFTSIIAIIIFMFGISTTTYNISPLFKIKIDFLYTDVTNVVINNKYGGSLGQRLMLMQIGAAVFKENFWLGTGIGDEAIGIQKHAKKYETTGMSTQGQYANIPTSQHNIDYHNLYLQNAVQLGILGLILMVYLVYSLFLIKLKHQLYNNINLAFSISILLNALGSNLLHSLFPVALFSFFVAILSALSRNKY